MIHPDRGPTTQGVSSFMFVIYVIYSQGVVCVMFVIYVIYGQGVVCVIVYTLVVYYFFGGLFVYHRGTTLYVFF